MVLMYCNYSSLPILTSFRISAFLFCFAFLFSPLIQDGLLAIFVTRSKWCVCIYSKVYTVQYIQYIQYIIYGALAHQMKLY